MTEEGNGGWKIVTDGETVKDIPGSSLGQGIEVGNLRGSTAFSKISVIGSEGSCRRRAAISLEPHVRLWRLQVPGEGV